MLYTLLHLPGDAGERRNSGNGGREGDSRCGERESSISVRVCEDILFTACPNWAQARCKPDRFYKPAMNYLLYSPKTKNTHTPQISKLQRMTPEPVRTGQTPQQWLLNGEEQT